MENYSVIMDSVLNKLAVKMNEVMFAPKGADPGNVLIHFDIGNMKKYLGFVNCPPMRLNELDVTSISICKCIFSYSEDKIDVLMTTIAHEMVHAYNMRVGVCDYKRKKHLQAFKNVCDSIGLPCEEDDKFGFYTPSQHLDIYDEVLTVLSVEEKAFLDNLKDMTNYNIEKKKRAKTPVFACPMCGNKVKGKDLNIICGYCEEKYVELDE